MTIDIICHIISTVKYFDWSEDKNRRLKEERDVSFEEVLIAISEGQLLDIIEHPKKQRYKNQKIMIVNISQYVYLVPFVEDKEKLFLKTIIPSRKATKKYLIEKRG